MRAAALLVLATLATPCRAEMHLTREGCTGGAAGTGEIARSARSGAEMLSGNSFEPLAANAEGDMKIAARRVEDARLKLVEVQRQYADAMEALSLQFRACAQ